MRPCLRSRSARGTCCSAIELHRPRPTIGFEPIPAASRGEVTPTCASGTAKSRDSSPRSRLRLEAGVAPAWSVSQTDFWREVPARFAPGRNIQLCHEREHHRRPGATRTRACSLGGSCPVRWTTGRGDAPGNRPSSRTPYQDLAASARSQPPCRFAVRLKWQFAHTTSHLKISAYSAPAIPVVSETRSGIEPDKRRVCNPPPAPARCAPRSQQDSNLRSLPSEGSVLSAWTMRAGVGRDGFEPPCP
jgi:hypothetical protein